jgi:hypothetical protein
VPAGGDVYVLSRVLHNWDDARCLTLLSNCHAAMAVGGALVIIEHLVPAAGVDDEVRAMNVALDINMMALFGGRERTWHDFRELLAAGGFELLPEGRPLPADLTLLTARRR